MTRHKYINKPFNRLPLKLRACFILHHAGFSCRDIERAFGTPYRTVSRYIAIACEEYDEEYGTLLPQSEDI